MYDVKNCKRKQRMSGYQRFNGGLCPQQSYLYRIQDPQLRMFWKCSNTNQALVFESFTQAAFNFGTFQRTPCWTICQRQIISFLKSQNFLTFFNSIYNICIYRSFYSTRCICTYPFPVFLHILLYFSGYHYIF